MFKIAYSLCLTGKWLGGTMVSFQTFSLIALCLISALYATFILFLSRSSAEKRCNAISSLDLGHDCQPPVELNHVKDCRLCLEAAIPVMDRYVVAHLFGWAIKAFILPFPFLLLLASITFELLELVLKPFLPALAECWWDSWILDVFGCNAIGIFIGLQLRHHSAKFSLFSQTGRNRRRNLTFGQFIVLLTSLTVTDINAFLLKYKLMIRSASPLNVYRIALFVILGMFAVQPCSPKSLLRSRFAMLYISLVAVEILFLLIPWDIYS